LEKKNEKRGLFFIRKLSPNDAKFFNFTDNQLTVIHRTTKKAKKKEKTLKKFFFFFLNNLKKKQKRWSPLQ